MRKYLCCLIIFILVLCSFLSFNFIFVNATTNSDYTDVLDDLNKDSSFKISDYPVIHPDYMFEINNDLNPNNDQLHMEVIQIAESSSNELYIYVYQPCDPYIELYATSILLSDEYSANGQDIYPNIFVLELVSTYNQFDKYVVKDFQISNESYRYYNLVTLYRSFNSDIDVLLDGTEIENTEIGMEIGQQWSCYYLNNKLVYEKGTFETIEIEIDYTGHFEFSSGIKWGNLVGAFDYGHSWFIAFSTDEYVIEHIYDADLVYRERTARTYWQSFVGEETTYGEWSDDIKITLTDNDEPVIYDGGGLFSKVYSWNRISSSSDFIKNAESQDIKINDECKIKIQESQWVFSFKETELEFSSGDGWYRTNFTDIDKVTIIRLHFIDNTGEEYSLGVVSDRVNPDNKADGNGTGIDIEDDLKKLFLIISLLILLLLFALIKPVADTIIFILSLPFVIIKDIFNIGKRKKP